MKVIAKYSAVQLAMTILLNGAINKSKIHWLIILVCVRVVSFSGHGAHGENLNSHDLTKMLERNWPFWMLHKSALE